MIASTPTPSKPLSRNIRAAVATIRLRFSAACSRLTRIAAPRRRSLDRIYDAHHQYAKMTIVINKPKLSRTSSYQHEELVMTDIPYRTALIVGAGSGISASVARGLAAAGVNVGLAARNVEKLVPLATETRAQTFAVDASDPAAVARLFDDADTRLGAPHVVFSNASARAHGPIAELDPEDVRKAVEISAFGGFL